MSIFEYDEEKELAMFGEAEREVGIEIGKEIGKEVGKELGELKIKFALVRKKAEKGLNAGEIAELLEEDKELVREMLEAIHSNPEASDEELALQAMEDKLKE